MYFPRNDYLLLALLGFLFAKELKLAIFVW